MTLAPPPLVRLVARRRQRRLEARLRAAGDGRAAQRAAYRALVARFAATEIGRSHQVGPALGYADFRTRVPLRAAGDFHAFATRMAGGAADVLWPGTCDRFVYTAGTVDGTPRMLPATPEFRAHLRSAVADAWLLLAARGAGPAIFNGRHAQLGTSAALSAAGGAQAGFLDGLVRSVLSDWSRTYLLAPSESVAAQPEGAAKTAAVAGELAAADVRVLAGPPKALLDALAAGPWPRLAACVHTGALPVFSASALATAAGRAVLHEIHAAAEGVFAVQDGDASAGLRLLADAGLFLEFLPVRELGVAPLSALGPRCVPLDEVQAGVEYALVATTPAGLLRCMVGDTVRFVGLAPPRIVVTGRTELRLASFGESVGEREATEVLLDVCARNAWDPVCFHVAPSFLRPAPRPAGRHEWWVELKPGTVRTPTGPVLAAEIDDELVRRNPTYADRRAAGVLESAVVRLVMPGIFAEHARLHPPFGGAAKAARCRNDRIVAEQLAGVARFHAGTIPPFPVRPGAAG
jgi:hypothetical protein